MRRRRLIWHLFPTYLFITLLSALAVGWYASAALREFYVSQTSADLEDHANLMIQRLSGVFPTESSPALTAMCGRAGAVARTRFTFILPSGKVVADSDNDPATMDNHASRPEVRTALAGRVGMATRRSGTMHLDERYIAVPMMLDGRVTGVVRAARTIGALQEALADVSGRIAIGGVVIAAIATVLSIWVSRRMAAPIARLRAAAADFAAGDLRRQLPPVDTEELSDLADALTTMAKQLDDRMTELRTERNEREAILASMVEGVIAVDTSDKVLLANAAADRLVGTRVQMVPGRTLQETIRNPVLNDLLARAQTSEEPQDDEMTVRDAPERVLHVTVAPLHDRDDNRIGALVVLNDVTQLRRLERMRRDFVANVSHELRTPISALRGAIEVLREGADPADVERFHEMIARNTDRLNNIVTDLLALAKLEENADAIALEPQPLLPTIRNAVAALAAKAAEAGIEVHFSVDPGLRVEMDSTLMEQAVANLLDNAIRFTGTGKRVSVEAEDCGERVAIHVRDEGTGIDAHHLPRLFERFYRADPARSRKDGGTGLGLAIVKHIVQAHHGEVAVESTPGQGSTFTIWLPTPDRR